MKINFSILVPLCVFIAVRSIGGPLEDIAAMDETQLDAILASDHSVAEKDAACARLKRIATPRSVPALAKLLTDDRLSHSARYALESLPGPEVDRALLDALTNTSGSNQVGIVTSLAVRREAQAAPALTALLTNSDVTTARVAAEALGRIGGGDAVHALEAGVSQSSGPVHGAEIDSLLACAAESVTKGDAPAAMEIYKRVGSSETNELTRVAAFRGFILAAGQDGVEFAVDALAGNDVAKQQAALQVAAELPGGGSTTKRLADLLATTPSAMQISLLRCLQQRGDSTALPSVAAQVENADVDVRMAAITALGELGDGSVALLLAKKAAAASGVERNAAREALIDLRRGVATEAMVALLENAPGPAQTELIQALGNRGDTSAAARLLKWAANSDDSIRAAAFQSLGLIAGQSQVPDLVRLAVIANDDDARSEAVEALTAACQHIEAQSGHCDAQSLTDAERTAPVGTRLALLTVCAAVIEPSTRESLRAAVADAQPEVREAAMRALCDSRDGELLPDLVKLTSIQGNKKIRTLAIRGTVRLATQENDVKISNDQKLEILQKFLALPLDTDDKKVVLSGLGATPDKRTLVMLMPMLDDGSVQAEAAAAVLRVSEAISSQKNPEASEALKKVLARSALTPDMRKAAEDQLKALQ